MNENKSLLNQSYISDTFVGESSLYDVSADNLPKGVLKIIEGPLAEWVNLNRNSRKYSERLWDNVLDSSYVKEQLQYETLYGEANHPTDRFEVDFKRVSHSIVKLWKVPSENRVYGRIYILDTPFGRILNTLYDAGGIIGYSSRAGGLLINRKDYIEVDEKTYNFITFDAVPYPSVVAARPGVITESSVDVQEVLPKCIHEELCRIISESTGSVLESVKEFIYSIQGFNLSEEKLLLESMENGSNNIGGNNNIRNNSIDSNNSNNTTSSVVNEDHSEDKSKIETTLSLLKESSLEIGNLKAENLTLRTDNESLKKENSNLKSCLDDSLGKVSALTGKICQLNEQRLTMVSESSIDDTIASLNKKVEGLKSVIEDKDLELLELESIKEAFKALRLENDSLKAQVVSESKSVVRTVAESDLQDANREISSMVKELSDKESKIRSLTESVEKLKSLKVSEHNSTKGECDRLRDEVASLKEDKKRLVKESRELDEYYSKIIDELKVSNTSLSNEISSISESAGKRMDTENSYAKELVSVIASSYNLNPNEVTKHLSKGFSKSDVYNVCESLSNSEKKGVRYETIAESASGVSTENIRTDNLSPNTPKIAGIMDSTGNRRGVGLVI